MHRTIDISLLDANGDTVIVRAGGLEGDYLEATPGASLTIPHFTTQRNLTVAAGETYTVAAGTWEYFNTVRVEDGGVFDVDGTAVASDVTTVGSGTVDVDSATGEVQATGSAYSAYNRIRDLIDAAGNGTVELDYQGTPLYQDVVRPKANVNSVVIKVEGVNIPEMRDVWCHVTGGDDATEIIASKEDLELDTTIIAPVSEYPDRTTLSNALEVTGLSL